MERDKEEEGFTDLSKFSNVGIPAKDPHLNVIKRVHIVHKGTEEILRESMDPDQPEILVRRDGDTILSVDFVCKCGRSTSLRFEYDEEQPSVG